MKPIEIETCGLNAALAVIAGKWKPTIIWVLHAAPTRFGALRRQIPGISEKVLFQQLRELEADGVVRRRVFEGAVLHVEYSLTASGQVLNTATHALSVWGTGHAATRSAVELLSG
ncbi:winged helix-turn-helix transcriptional regulator [Caulobacter mirabilis]|uniref:Transcriptional regulator n=1 Tax=Caulobacter mirabilis TaxID=69666 RepID=A0A2D2AWQ3_9CAUL|nr:helix-turn-helix domain-containing protein [Caulobacter mirabilis]ATQ42438.1 transcriptional regulator [Caulobacter mirabilis]